MLSKLTKLELQQLRQEVDFRLTHNTCSSAQEQDKFEADLCLIEEIDLLIYL